MPHRETIEQCASVSIQWLFSASVDFAISNDYHEANKSWQNISETEISVAVAPLQNI